MYALSVNLPVALIQLVEKKASQVPIIGMMSSSCTSPHSRSCAFYGVSKRPLAFFFVDVEQKSSFVRGMHGNDEHNDVILSKVIEAFYGVTNR